MYASANVKPLSRTLDHHRDTHTHKIKIRIVIIENEALGKKIIYPMVDSIITHISEIRIKSKWIFNSKRVFSRWFLKWNLLVLIFVLIFGLTLCHTTQPLCIQTKQECHSTAWCVHFQFQKLWFNQQMLASNMYKYSTDVLLRLCGPADNSPAQKIICEMNHNIRIKSIIKNEKYKKIKNLLIRVSLSLVFSLWNSCFVHRLSSVMMIRRLCVLFTGRFKISSTQYENYIFPNSVIAHCDLNIRHTHSRNQSKYGDHWYAYRVFRNLCAVRVQWNFSAQWHRKKRWCYRSLSFAQ